MSTTTNFLSLTKPDGTDRVKIDDINGNSDKIENQLERNVIKLTYTGNSASVTATGPCYKIKNNNASAITVTAEGTIEQEIEPGEELKFTKNTVDSFTLTVTCASNFTLTFFQRNKDYTDNKIASHTHNYAGSSTAGGAATSASRLSNASSIGGTTNPTYFTQNGVPAACTYSLNKTVPADAEFTDTKAEYSTTEHVIGTWIDGRAIYSKTVMTGALPDSSTKTIPHYIQNLDFFISISGTARMDGASKTTISIPTASLASPITLYADATNVHITTVTDRSNVTYGHITVTYVKATD